MARSSEYYKVFFKTAQSQAEWVHHWEAFLSNNTSEVTAEALVSTQTLLLSKQVQTIVIGRQRDVQMIEFSGTNTLLGKPMVI